MDSQDWKPVVLKKTPQTVKKQTSVEKNTISPTDSLDFNEKPIEFFTLAMGRKIASLRSEKKWTQEELAQKLCIPKKTIIDLEQGKEKYNGPLLSKLKRVLGNFSW